MLQGRKSRIAHPLYRVTRSGHDELYHFFKILIDKGERIIQSEVRASHKVSICRPLSKWSSGVRSRVLWSGGPLTRCRIVERIGGPDPVINFNEFSDLFGEILSDAQALSILHIKLKIAWI